MKLKLFVILAVVAVLALAQTGSKTVLPLSQVAFPATTTDSLLVLSASGVQFVQLGTGLVLNKSTVPWTLSAAVPAPLPLRSERATRNTDGTWSISYTPAGAVAIYRNGLYMTPTIDYSLVGQTITFTPGQGSLATDIIAVLGQ